MTAQRILFTGSRTYADREMVAALLWGFSAGALGNPAGDIHIPVKVAHGDAPGLDTLVKEEARKIRAMLLMVTPYPADWQRCAPNHPHVPCPDDGGRHRRYRKLDRSSDETYCPLAGPRRNQDMLDDFKPGAVIALIDKPLVSSRGTFDMCDRAAQAGVPLHWITSLPPGTKLTPELIHDGAEQLNLLEKR